MRNTPSAASQPDHIPGAKVPLSPTPDGAGPAGPSDTPLPNERDEGKGDGEGTTGGIPSDQIKQAHQDVQRGLRDTSRGEATDEAYRKQQ